MLRSIKFAVCLALLILVSVVQAQIPQTMSYQGILTDGSGVNVPDGNYNLTFKLYDVASGAIPALWSEGQLVQVNKGVFNVMLGSVNPLNLQFDKQYWLGIAVGLNPELTPRVQLASAAYSLNTRSIVNGQAVKSLNGLTDAVTLVGAGGATVTTSGNTITLTASGGGTGILGVQNTNSTLDIANGTGPTATINVRNQGITSTQLADNAVTSTKIASGQVVTSVNNLKDAVTLNAGSNISIAPSGNSLTINSTGGSGIQGVQNTNNTVEITNPNGPTATINVKDQGITTTQLADNSVTSAKIQDGQVQTNDLANASVTQAKIAAGVTLPPSGTAGGDLTGTYPNPTIASNAVTSGKIASGQVVKSVNTLKDDVTLAAGSNVTITPGGNTLTIAAIGSGDITAVNAGTGLDGGGSSGDVSLSIAVPLSLSGNSSNPIIGGSNTGIGNGVYGSSRSIGVFGSTSSGTGVYGESSIGDGVSGFSTSGYGVLGQSSSSTGVNGYSNTGTGVYGSNSSGNSGSLGSSISGVRGNSSNSYGVYGSSTSSIGVFGGSSSNFGVGGLSSSSYGVYGESSSNDGVRGISISGDGVRGNSSSGYGVRGISSTTTGVVGNSNSGYGVAGLSSSNYGVIGESSSGNYGYLGSSGNGVYGNSSSGYGVNGYSITGAGVFGSSSAAGYAGYFIGNVAVIGILSKSGGAFKIDHPLDPANKYLYHSFVESPDMLNIYNGNVITDANGDASVILPEYFEVLNREFRYQLTVIGQFAQAIVKEKVQNNRFTIKTDKPNVEVSWQVTGIRHDPFAEQHRIPVEELKTGKEAGKYLYPKEHGVSETLGIDYERIHDMEIKRKADEEKSLVIKQ